MNNTNLDFVRDLLGVNLFNNHKQSNGDSNDHSSRGKPKRYK